MLSIALILWGAAGVILTLLPVYQWTLQLAVAWIPLYLTGTLLGGALAAWRRQWTWCAAAAVVSGVCILIMAPAFATPPNRAESSETPNLRVLTINVWDRCANPAGILAYIDETDPDIVAVQEATAEWVERLRPLEAKYPRSYTPPRFRPGMPALALYWRVESGEPSHRFEEGLPMLHLPITVAGKHLDFVNAHPRAPFTADRAVTHRRMLGGLTTWLNTLENPRIVAGDLNTSIWSMLYRDFQKQTQLVNTRQGYGIQGTWPSWLGPFRTTLDHILVEAGIAVAQLQVGPHVGSDHRPLLADLVIR
jgi:endonuclease/exonuclease/phosphatase (EEP) superfamily protein YafD